MSGNASAATSVCRVRDDGRLELVDRVRAEAVDAGHAGALGSTGSDAVVDLRQRTYTVRAAGPRTRAPR